MTLLEVHSDVSRIADALERIVFLLEKLVLDSPPQDVKVVQATLDDLHIIDPEETQRIADAAMRFAELHRVVPGSQAFAEELLYWEAQQKEIHGEKWEAPDWAEIFAGAFRPDVSNSSRVRRQPVAEPERT